MFLVKKDLVKWPVLAKQPINVSFCDIVVLLNHLNSVIRN